MAGRHTGASLQGSLGETEAVPGEAGRGGGCSGSGHQPETGLEEMTKTEPCGVAAHPSKEPKNWGPKAEGETGRGRERKKVLSSLTVEAVRGQGSPGGGKPVGWGQV